MVINGRELTCLIIDDQPEPARRWLLQRGIPTSVAKTREEALLLIDKRQFSMTLLDYSISGLPVNGFIATMRKLSPKMQIILTMNDKNTYEIASKLGIGLVIQKPYDEDFLFSYISRFYRSKQASGVYSPVF